MKKLAAVLLLTPLYAFAGATLSLSAEAKIQVPNDEMVVNLAITREGADATPLTDAVLITLNNAIKEATLTAGVQAKLGSVWTYPTWSSGQKTGWQVRGDILLTSLDMKALATLTGRLTQKLQITNVYFRLSNIRKDKEEKALLTVVAANFKQKALATATAFGYPRYEIKELTVGQNNSGGMPSPMAMMSTTRADKSMANLPIEGGDSEVSVFVTGLVSLGD
ncbi:MAG: SIMPL domain-containing protein [Agitococcus sp.]|nr:SIMPL domain-containing protein [Agitococcus sp.]MDO9177159.1 SIMPL domain-containing protein [Agitococcus sp.]